MAEVVVTVKQGKLKGKTGKDFKGKPYYIFQGIPYAKPPIGNLRFKDPQAVESWDDVRDCTKEGPGCFQKNPLEGKLSGSEDCLYLNVYAPQTGENEDNSLKPVMFWIHGGGFYCGSGDAEIYGPDFLVSNNVVLVTINYRVGLLGFLKLEDPNLEVPGNAGLKDIVAALRWIKENIENFSGDPNNVTIFGESAGSAAVQYLLLSPLSKGLYHKAIMQSGSVFNSWARGYQRNELFSELLGLETVDEKEILKRFQEFTANELLDFQESLKENIFDGSKRPYGPCVERPSECAFLPDEPKNIVQSGAFNKVPTIIGYCDSEGKLGTFWEPLNGRQPIHSNFENFVPYAFGLRKSSEESKRVAQRIKTFYYKDEEPSLETLQSYTELETDFLFSYGIQKSIENIVQKSELPVFFYRFCFDGELNSMKKFMKCSVKGACHADDLSYLFKPISQVENPKDGSAEQVMVMRLTKLWTNFAKYGNPTPQGVDDLVNIEWEQVGKNGLNYLNIDRELSLGVNPDAKRMEFWDTLYDEYPSAKFW